MSDLPPQPGTYILLLRVDAALTIPVGRTGRRADLLPGWYAYTGSAQGPGGLRARVGRHLRQDKRPHWHIDALTAAAPIRQVWYAAGPDNLECAWAASLQKLPGVNIPVAGFGASDCTCPAHLLTLPDPTAAQEAIRRQTPALRVYPAP